MNVDAPLPDDFYDRPVLEVAPDLLNKVLVTGSSADERRGRIVEVEAYAGEDDPGSHGWRGITPRTTVMFGPPGHWYVYLSYGVHWCANVVCGPEGTCAAVLLRSVEPLAGVDAIRDRRGQKVRDRDLTNGPGKLGQAFDLDESLYGAQIATSRVRIVDDGTRPPMHPIRTPRIGLSEGRGETLPYRFVIDLPRPRVPRTSSSSLSIGASLRRRNGGDGIARFRSVEPGEPSFAGLTTSDGRAISMALVPALV